MSLLEDGPIRRVLRERGKLLELRRKYPKEAFDMAFKMMENWLKKVSK